MTLFAKGIGTFLGIGFFPAAPGTAATAVGLGLAYLLKDNNGLYLGAIAIFFALGLWASSHLEKALNEKDPGIVVIDEVVGVMIAFWAIPFSWPVAISGFFLFRAFDMFKIYPINRLESIPGGLGIMADDVMAGVYTNIILSIAVRWAGA